MLRSGQCDCCGYRREDRTVPEDTHCIVQISRSAIRNASRFFNVSSVKLKRDISVSSREITYMDEILISLNPHQYHTGHRGYIRTLEPKVTGEH